MDHLWHLLGRLHPAAVHLPIGIFVLLAMVELAALLPRGPKVSDAQRSLVLALGLAIALATALFGWLLAREGGYDAALLDRHRWLGFSFAALAAILLAVQLGGWRRTYGVLLIATVVVLGAAGHFGGSLTHGEDYLTAWATKGAAPVNPAQALAFAHVIHPILQQRCVSCHGAAKTNGDLRYDTLENLLKGGKNGPAFKAGDATASRMIQRVHLPLDAKEHMPPKGKPQLTDDEASLLEWWIDAGAPADKRVAELSPPPAIAESIATRLGVPPPPPPDRAKMLAAAETLERTLGVIIRPLTTDVPWLTVNARLQFDKFGDAQLAELEPIAPAIQWLDLGETAVTDAGLTALASMKNLRQLHLDRTAITDAGLGRLSTLTKLESLDLHATKVGDAGLAALRALPRLRSLYLWQTQVTPEAVAKFGEQQTDQRKIARWKTEIAALEARIRSEHFTANLGESLRKVTTASAAPVTATPPPAPALSGAPAPAAVAKSAVAAPAPVSAGPVNTVCPVSGEPVDSNVTELVGGKVVAFCCEACREEFRAQPEKFPLTAKR